LKSVIAVLERVARRKGCCFQRSKFFFVSCLKTRPLVGRQSGNASREP
jgi:hypothetical protein